MLDQLTNLVMSNIPAALAIITPVIVTAVRSGAASFVKAIPKPLLPIVAAVVGVLGEFLVTSGISTDGVTGGLAGVGVFEAVKRAIK